jgi:DNA-binding NarL/FixJ family response regulator
MPRVPEPYIRGIAGEAHGGITRSTYQTAHSRVRAGKPFELTWRDKIYLRAIRNGETMTAIGKRMNLSTAAISESLRNASRRFGVQSYKELLTHEEALKQLEE